MFKLPTIISKTYAADLGEIRGLGNFQFENNKITINNISVGYWLGELLSRIITTLTIVSGLAFVVYFMLGAFKWITSGGDQNKTEEAKRQLTQAAIGIIVVVVSYFIISIIGSVLGFDLLNPAKSLGIN
jgi:hypothetical protein